MTTVEILDEIQKLPLPEQRALADKLQRSLPVNGGPAALTELTELTGDELEQREEAFARKLLAKGLFSRIPTQPMTDEEFFEDFELLEIEGEPLSEQIIRERR